MKVEIVGRVIGDQEVAATMSRVVLEKMWVTKEASDDSLISEVMGRGRNHRVVDGTIVYDEERPINVLDIRPSELEHIFKTMIHVQLVSGDPYPILHFK